MNDKLEVLIQEEIENVLRLREETENRIERMGMIDTKGQLRMVELEKDAYAPCNDPKYQPKEGASDEEIDRLWEEKEAEIRKRRNNPVLLAEKEAMIERTFRIQLLRNDSEVYTEVINFLGEVSCRRREMPKLSIYYMTSEGLPRGDLVFEYFVKGKIDRIRRKLPSYEKTLAEISKDPILDEFGTDFRQAYESIKSELKDTPNEALEKWKQEGRTLNHSVDVWSALEHMHEGAAKKYQDKVKEIRKNELILDALTRIYEKYKGENEVA